MGKSAADIQCRPALQSTVNDAVDTGHRQAGLGDIGGQYYAPVPVLTQGGSLLLQFERSVEHHGVVVAQQVSRLLNLTNARQEDQDSLRIFL